MHIKYAKFKSLHLEARKIFSAIAGPVLYSPSEAVILITQWQRSDLLKLFVFADNVLSSPSCWTLPAKFHPEGRVWLPAKTVNDGHGQ